MMHPDHLQLKLESYLIPICSLKRILFFVKSKDECMIQKIFQGNPINKNYSTNSVQQLRWLTKAYSACRKAL